ncbi:MAG: hypothetical protein ACLQNE_18475 [Thermoguttaceae bacterium]
MLPLIPLLVLWTNTQAQTPVVGPWHFGMTKAEVTAFEKFGPYKDVRATGGTETFNAVFDGKKANISFVFDEKGLKRIMVWAYEGRSQEDASNAWASLYSYMKKTYGPIEVPQIEAGPKSEPLTPDVLAIAAITHVATVGKVQMAPKKMPIEARVFSSFASRDIQGIPSFYLFLYFDRPSPSVPPGLNRGNQP